MPDDRAHRAGRGEARSPGAAEYSGERAAYGAHRRRPLRRLPHDLLLLHGYRGVNRPENQFLTEPRRRRTSAFIGQRNSGAGLWHTGMASGGKLWSKSVLVPSCPPQSLTSVVAIHCLVARCPAKGALDPVGEFAFS